jgi:hypothetical protein
MIMIHESAGAVILFQTAIALAAEFNKKANAQDRSRFHEKMRGILLKLKKIAEEEEKIKI